jgi:hypothetical protein
VVFGFQKARGGIFHTYSGKKTTAAHCSIKLASIGFLNLNHFSTIFLVALCLLASNVCSAIETARKAGELEKEVVVVGSAF